MSKPKLKLVKPAEEELFVNMVLYGEPKTGKTVGATSAPKPLLLVNADRPNSSRFAHRRHDFDEVRVEGLETLGQVAEEATNYRTVVIDQVSEVYRIVLEGLSKRALSPAIQLYGDTGTHLERFCRHLVELPVNTVFVAIPFLAPDESSGKIEKWPYTGTKNPVFAQKLMAMVDVIGYTGTSAPKDGEIEYLAQLYEGGGRRGGDRFGVLGRDRKLDLSDWIAEIQKKTTTTEARSSERRTRAEGAAA